MGNAGGSGQGCCSIQGRGRDGLDTANRTKLGEPSLKLKDLKIC